MPVALLPLLDIGRWFPAADPQRQPTAIGTYVLASAIKIMVIFGVYMLGVAFLTLAERKLAAWIQDRRGPNRAGPGGILQPVADGIKNFMKEETNPAEADRWLFLIAPALAFIPAMLTWAVLPLAASLPTPWGLIDMAIAPLPVGFLFMLAISSLGVYGIVLAGWASNSKYSLLGGLRSSAQMISYELAYGMSLATVVMFSGSMSLREIVDLQQGYWFGVIPKWYIFIQPIAFFVFACAGIAETNRAPFDFPEAEQELVAGYHTEYSSMRFAMFFMAEYINMVTVSAVAVNLFLGGWHGPFIPPEYGWIWFLIKLAFLLFCYLWLRWTLPRFRYDQLMSFGWKVLLPVATVNLLLTAAGVLYFGL